MKKLFFLLYLTFIGVVSHAEDVVQIIPFQTIAGVTANNNQTFSIALTNTTGVWGAEFYLYLPDGMEIVYDDEEEEYMVENNTRCPKKLQTTLVYNSTNKYYKFVMYNSTNTKVIESGSGEIVSVTFTTNNAMVDGIYEIYVRSTVLSDVDSKSIDTPAETSSYVVIDNDGNSNPLAKNAHVDLSGMTGYIPSFVVNQLNTDIASNTSLKSLNLSGTSFENLGAALNVPNNNDLLWYTSDKASLNRTFNVGNWSTVCLPFTLETITVNTLLNNGCAVKGMTSYDSSEKTVTFDDVNTMSTGVPYLFKCSDLKTKPFENIDITNPEAIRTGPHNVTDNNLTFKGTYELDELSSTGLITIYGYKDNQFVKVESGQSGKVQPFRAYMELSGGVGTRGFISIDGLDDATGINEIVVPDAEKTTPIYDLQGRKVNGNYHSRGILIQNGKKIIKK